MSFKNNLQKWTVWKKYVKKVLNDVQIITTKYKYKPDSIAWMALAFASSRAVTHCCLSTSVDALMWKVCVPPLLTTKVQASTVCIKAPCKEIVPRQVWDISAGFLKQEKWRQSRVLTCLWNCLAIAEWHRKRQTWVCNCRLDYRCFLWLWRSDFSWQKNWSI